MDLLIPSSAAVAWLLVALFIAITLPLLFYGYLADQTWFEGKGKVQPRAFGPLDALIAGGLGLLFAASSVNGFIAPAPADAAKLPSSAAMILGVVLSALFLLVIMGVIIGSLVLRNLPWREAFGLNQLGIGEVVARGGLLLLLALPLIYATMAVTRVLLAAAGHPEEGLQEIVRFLDEGGSGPARVVVAVSAVFVAPVQEEFIFRGYLYGVVRRYAGPFAGVVVNALLFAGIHVNAASFGALFVLAVCLTLAYEWTGSIFVPMTMHALFNSLNIYSLLTGGGDQ